MGALLLAFAVIFNTVANSLLKFGLDLQDLTLRKGLFIGFGLFLGLLNTLCYMKALEKIDLGVAYTVFSAASIILIALASVFFFKEAWSLQKAAGLATICIGLLLVWRA